MNSVHIFVFVQTEIVLLKIVLLRNFFWSLGSLGYANFDVRGLQEYKWILKRVRSCLDESGHEAMLEFPNQLQTKYLIKSTNVASNYKVVKKYF